MILARSNTEANCKVSHDVAKYLCDFTHMKTPIEQNIFIKLARNLELTAFFVIIGLCLYYLQDQYLHYFKMPELPILLLGIFTLTLATVFNISSGIIYGIMKSMFIKTPRADVLRSDDKGSFNFTLGLYLLALVGELVLIWYLIFS